MIWTGLTVPAVQLTYPDNASIEPSNYSLHHPNRNSASPTLCQPRCMDFEDSKMTIEIKDVVAPNRAAICLPNAVFTFIYLFFKVKAQYSVHGIGIGMRVTLPKVPLAHGQLGSLVVADLPQM
eukprot:scaffold11036_cov68-Cyclotella_meneghiniana.AAC.4